MTTTINNVVLDIAMERRRQRDVEGFDEEHDGLLMGGVLARQAASYAQHAADYRGAAYPPPLAMYRDREATMPEDWAGPWDMWKPDTPRRDLVRAAAMIVAEIERIDRAAP